MEQAVKLIRKAGIKMTSLRVQVLEMLMATNRSFSFNELYQYFDKQQNRSTFYRLVQCFDRNNIVQKVVDRDGVVRYFFRETQAVIEPCFTCHNCGKIINIAAIPDSYLKKLKGLEINCAMIQGLGLCQDCQKQSMVPNF